jgi:AcrR family transcriptional regulator
LCYLVHMVVTGAQARPLRADAARNRERILAAAQEVFAERGLDVTLDDIAAHAGLGVGTVYRRFADREALVEALFDQKMRAKLETVQAALTVPPEQAFDVLIDILRTNCEHLARDRGLRQVMLSSVYGQDEVARCRDEMNVAAEELVRRAKATGKLRPDFEPSDIAVLLLMIGAVADFAGAVDPELWRRYFDVMVDGLRAQATPAAMLSVDAPTCVPALAIKDLLTAMRSWRPPTLPQT